MTLPEIIYAILIVVFDFTVMYMLLDINLKDIKKRKAIFFLVVLLLTLIASVVITYKHGRTIFTAYFPLLVQVPMYIAYHAVSRYKGAKLFFVFLSTFIFSTPVIWSPFIVGAFVNYSINIMTLASLISYIVMLVIVKKQIAPLFHYALEYLKKGWISLSLLPIFYTALTYLTNQYDYTIQVWKETSYFRILILAIIYSAYVVIFVLFKQTREQGIMKNEQAMLRLKMDAMNAYLSELKNAQNMAAIYRHDLRHHLQYINTCISQANLEESKNYIKSICHEIEQACVIFYCENEAANMILSSYVTKAKTKAIAVTIATNIPTVIHIATTDLCVVLANAIENAIFACENMSDREKRKIAISSHIKNNKLFIQIVNPYEGDIAFQEGMPCANRVGHGMGVKSIVNIVKKYQGIYSFEAKDQIFTLGVII